MVAVWPTASGFSTNNFQDHFPGSTLDSSKWTAATTGSGTVSVSDSCLHMTAPAGSAAFVYYNTKLDKTKTQWWWICGSCEQRASSLGSNFFSLYNSSTPPTANTKSSLDPNRRLECGMGNQSGGLSLMAFYDPSGANQFWNNATSAWASYVNTRWSPAQLSDYYVWGLEFDGPNLRWRLHIYGQTFITAGTWQFDQGWREFGVTDWVNWSGQLTSTDLWLVLGRQNTDGGSTDEYKIEWVHYGEGPLMEAWAGAKDSDAAGHRIRKYYTLDGIHFVPLDRTSWALDLGASSPDNVEVHNPNVVYDGTSTDYMFYVGYDGTQHYVCVASATHSVPQNGPWTKQGVQVSQSGAGDDSAQINFPFIVCDQSEADPNKRWKMWYNGKSSSDNKWRTLYAASPSATGPWTKQGTVLNVGAAGSNDELWARSMSLVYEGGQWVMWYEGHDSNNVDHLLRATAPSLAGPWTKDGVTTYRDAATNQDHPLTADLVSAPGRLVTVDDTSGYTVDGMVLFSQSTDSKTWSASRIRSIISSTVLELYHGLTGFLSSYPTRMIQLSGSLTWNARCVIRVGSEWWFFSVVWEPFSSSAEKASYANVFEQCFLMKHSAALSSGSTPVYQNLSDPVIPRGYNSDSGSVENMSLFMSPFVGGTTFTQSLAGTLSSTGSPVKMAQKLVAGAVSIPGSTIRLLAKLVSGSLGSGGSTARLVDMVRSGAVNPVSTTIRSTAKSLGGTISSAGSSATTRVRLLLLSGSVALSSSASRLTSLLLASSTSLGGSTTKLASRVFGGLVTGAGNLLTGSSNLFVLAFSSSLSVAGSAAEVVQNLVRLGGKVFKSMGRGITVFRSRRP